MFQAESLGKCMRSFSSLNRNQETVANTYDCSLRIAENSSTSVSGYTITSRETRLNHFSHKPLMVTESNMAFTLLLSTVNEPDVGPLRTSTSTVATPSLLPSFTVNWNRYLDPLFRKGIAPLMSTDLGSVTNAYESPLGIYSWVICKLLRLTKANPGGKG